MDFARRAYDQSSDEEFRSNVLEYDDIQKLVHSDSRYDFLIDTTPKRIKFSEALSLLEEANKRKEEQIKHEKEVKRLKLEHDLQKKKEAEKLHIKEEKQEGGDEKCVENGQAGHDEEQSIKEENCNGKEECEDEDQEDEDEDHDDDDGEEEEELNNHNENEDHNDDNHENHQVENDHSNEEHSSLDDNDDEDDRPTCDDS